MRKKVSIALTLAILCGSFTAFADDVSEKAVNKNTSISDGSETQELIDSRPDIQRRMEYLDRGLIAVSAGNYGLISWRWLGTESASTMYNLYKNGVKLNDEPLNITNYIDYDAKSGDKYSVSAVVGGVEQEQCGEVSFNDKDYFEIPITAPEGGTVTQASGTEETYIYIANDATTADLDGDGEYEIILKWDPSNSRDSSNVGYTGNTYFDAYKLDGTRLWRIDMGVNIRSGAHDTQILAADFDNDGKGEFALRTADGTMDGQGSVIGDGEKDWRNENGKNLEGPQYITVFDGETGAAVDTAEIFPQSSGSYDGVEWGIADWGDDWGNRSERYNAAVAYLDGETPAMVFARGYYNRTVLAAYTIEDNKIKEIWTYDTLANGESGDIYRGQGNHSDAVADVDYDGRDEIIYGAEVFDDDGTPMYTTGLNHGDAQHTGDLIPSRPGLETYSVHEWGALGQDMRDARTGEIIWSSPFGTIDVGRGASDDIDPRYEGAESWSAMETLVSASGDIISESYSLPANFLAWWDGDLGREIQDSVYISKWNPYTEKVDTIFTAENCHSNNAAKANPSLTADLLGDWREEAVYPTEDNTALRIFCTTIPTSYRIPTLMHDPVYRNSVASQNVGYNQPTHTGYYLGYDTESVPVPQIYTLNDGEKAVNPDLSQGSWDIDGLYSGTYVSLAVESSKALINGSPSYIDGSGNEIYITNNRTMVPFRFLNEAFGAYVEWSEDTKSVTVKNTGAEIVMTADETAYTVNGVGKTSDTAPEIKNGTLFVPLRCAAEAMGLSAYWYDEGLVVIGDKAADISSVSDEIEKISESNASVPKSEAALKNGEKIVSSQAGVVKVETTDGSDASEAVDLNYDTYYTLNGGEVLRIEIDGYYALSSIHIAFADGDSTKHSFKAYTRWGYGEKDDDLTNLEGWALAVSSSNSGNTKSPEEYIMPVPKYGNLVKIILDDPNDAALITEIAATVVK